MTHRVGVIGAGGIAEVHAIAIREAGHEVAAICDVDRAKAEALAGQCGAATFDDLDAIKVYAIGPDLLLVPNLPL